MTLKSKPYSIFPLYVCIDVSASMEGPKIESLNYALQAIHEFVSSDPFINDKALIGVISFSSTAQVLLPLTHMADVVEFPSLNAKEATNFGNAFTCLKQAIHADISALKNQGYTNIQRPIVFFVSDGEPTDIGWQPIHDALVNKQFPYWPHVVTFGGHDAKVETLKKISTVRRGKHWAFFAGNYETLSSLFKSVLQELLYISGPLGREGFINLAPVENTLFVPVYLVLEESSALSEKSISAINQAIPEIHRVISIDRLINESVRVSIISFSDFAEVLLPLSNLSDVEEFPGLVAKGSANFQELFLALQKVLADDLSKLPQSINQYERPIVFIIAASNPNDESWREPLADLLIDPRFHSPHIVVLGAGETSASTMTDIATTSPAHHHRMAYRLTETSHPADIIRESLKTLYFETLQPNSD